MATRIYLVEVATHPDKAEHLVEASSKNQAILHVAKSLITVEIAKPKEISQLMKAGADVEVAWGAE